MRHFGRRSARGWTRGIFVSTLLGAGMGLGCGDDETSVAQSLEPAPTDDGAAPDSPPDMSTPSEATPSGDMTAPSAPADEAGESDGDPAGGAGIRALFVGPTGAGEVSNLYGLTFSSVGDQAGKLYASGVSGGNVIVLRFLENGTLDESFGTGGMVDTGEAGNSYGIVELSSGDLIVQGNGGGQTFLLKLDPAGALDAEFGKVVVLGWSAADVEAIDTACTAAAASPEDAEVVAGCTELWPAASAPEFAQRPSYTAWDLQLDTITTPGTEKLVLFGFGAPARAAEGPQRG